jgi:hypothetical protein
MVKDMWKMMMMGALAAMAMGCGASPTQLCKETVATSCKRAFECTTEQERAAPAFVAVFGASETECKSKGESNQCSKVNDSQPCADSSKKYDASKAAACIDDYKKASCETIRGGTFSSGNCTSVCS